MPDEGGNAERDQLERDKSGNAWTLGSLRLHLLSVIDERDRRYASQQEAGKEAISAALAAAEKAVSAAMAAAEKAVVKAETASDKRFESVNEFRATLADQQRLSDQRSTEQQRTFIPRVEVEVLLRGVNDRFASEIKSVNDRLTVELGGIRERLGKAEANRFGDTGRQAGKVAGWAMAVGVFGFVMTIVAAVLLLTRK